MTVQSGQTVARLFTIRAFVTGIGVNADSLPTAALYVNGVLNAASVSVFNVSTGLYRAVVTLPTLTFGDIVEIVVSAAVSTIADKCTVWQDINDVTAIQAGLATATAVAAIPTTPLLSSDTRLNNLDATITSRLSSATYTVPPTVVQIRTELDSNSTKLANLDATISSRLATSGYTTPPTVVQIRTEMDTNSTKLDATVSSRLATASYTAPPSVSAIQTGLATSAGVAAIPTNPLLTTDARLNNLDATITSRLAGSGYTTPPTVIQIRNEMDANSTKLTYLDTTISSRLASSNYTVPPSAASVRSEMDTNSIKLAYLDTSVSSRLPTSAYSSPTVPPTVVQIRQELDTNSTKLDVPVSSRTMPSDITAGLTFQGYTSTRAAYLDTLNGLVNSIWNAFAYSTTSFKSIIANFRFTVPNQVDANSLTSVGGGGGGTIQNIVYITPALAQASLTPNKILAKRGDLFSVALPAMGNISSRAGTNRLVFTVKTSVDDADSAAILQIVEGIGLTVFQGAPATDPAQGSITVSDATLGIAIVSVKGTAMAQMLVRDYVWDQQVILPTGPLSPNQGVFSVYGDVTRLT